MPKGSRSRWNSAKLVSAAPSLDGALWAIVFHDQESTVYNVGQSQVEPSKVYFPRAPSFALILDLADGKPTFRLLSDRVANQMSHLWAHLAQATVKVTMSQYYVSQILTKYGARAIKEQAYFYWRALLLRPNNAWALAHLGEVFRELANYWTADAGVLRPTEERLGNYVMALTCFKRAIELDPKYVWAHAHFGATIVNARAFAGWQTPDPYHELLARPEWYGNIDRLEQWNAKHRKLEPWSQKKNRFTRGTPQDWIKRFPRHITQYYNDQLINDAIEALTQAQKLRGRFYPWAQDYYGGALLVKAVLSDDRSIRGQLGILSMLHTSTAVYLQPELLTSVFEPGQVYVNAFFEIGIISSYKQDYFRAWEFTWIGMKWSFKFSFLPGLEQLVGCLILVHIAEVWMGLPRRRRRRLASRSNMIEESGLMSMDIDPDFHIPPVPIETEPALINFISRAYNKLALPAVEPYVEDSIAVNTKIRVGLMTTAFILSVFICVLESFLRPPFAWPGHQLLIGRLQDTLEQIARKLKMTITHDCSDPIHVLDSLFVLFEAGVPNSRLIDSMERLDDEPEPDEPTRSTA